MENDRGVASLDVQVVELEIEMSPLGKPCSLC